jgi:chloramphenicol-sensitive protein RarD
VSDGAPAPAPPSDVGRGLIAGAVAYAIWGLFPLYLKQLGGVSAGEVVAHRILWSIPFGAALLLAAGQWREVAGALARPRVAGLLALAALLIGVNWLVYVWAVAHERVLEASLGYYINPLMFVAAGVVVLKETLNRTQIAAVALAAIGVLVLIVGADVIPWPSLVLAVSFAAYGYVRKTTPVGAMPGLFIEVALLSPLALAYASWLSARDALAFAGEGLGLDALLVAAGPITIAPLVLFAFAARRLRLSTLGFLQYIGPTGQFALGLYYGERFTLAHAVCFALIWTALALVSIDAVRRNRRPPPVTRSVAASPKNS